MKRIVGIILIIVGIALGFMAYNRHEEDKTIIDLGKVEIKNQDKKPSESTTLYYILAALLVIGGGVLATRNKA